VVSVEPFAVLATESIIKSALRALGRSDSKEKQDPHPEVTEEIAKLVRERLASDPDGASTLTAVESDPTSPDRQQLLQNKLVGVVVTDHVFTGKLLGMAAKIDGSDSRTAVAATARPEGGSAHAEVPNTAAQDHSAHDQRRRQDNVPVRGFPGLTIAAASPQTTAGSDFSIFVLVQNPFNVPITIYQVQTHIPVELIDVNRLRTQYASLSKADHNGNELRDNKSTVWTRHQQRKKLRQEHPGVAVAVGTEFSPEEAGQLFRSEVNIGAGLNLHPGSSANFSALSVILPPDASSDNLDAIMRRMFDYQRGVLPVQLQPGDAVVRQFVLRTRSRVLFRPLSHAFQIQVNYSVDGVDHTGTIPYNLSIQAALGSIMWGAALGAAVGTLVKGLTSSPPISTGATLRALAIALMTSSVIVIAFSRKSSAQPFISVEDFWGGLVIGFAVGYFGFHQFLSLFPEGTGNNPSLPAASG
jgi:hypothetical protein